MSNDAIRIHQPDASVSEEALARAEEMIEQEEGIQNRHAGWLLGLVGTVAVVMSLFHLYTAYAIVRPEHLRATHVAFVLFLAFLVFPVAKRYRHRLMWWDVAFALLSLACIGWMIAGGDDFTDRNISPTRWDEVFGVALIFLVVEATRRTSGWVMPIVIGFFIL